MGVHGRLGTLRRERGAFDYVTYREITLRKQMYVDFDQSIRQARVSMSHQQPIPQFTGYPQCGYLLELVLGNYFPERLSMERRDLKFKR